MSNICTGVIGPPKHWCPYCDLLWDNEFEDEYNLHMESHGSPSCRGYMSVTSVCKETATVTFSAIKMKA